MTADAKGGDTRHLRFEPAGTPHTFRTVLPPDLVYFQGHFETFPILPGVVQLSRIVMPLVRREYPDLGEVRKLRRVRFRRPIGPNKTITVTLSRAELRVSFAITLDGDVAAEGTIELHPRPGAAA